MRVKGGRCGERNTIDQDQWRRCFWHCAYQEKNYVFLLLKSKTPTPLKWPLYGVCVWIARPRYFPLILLLLYKACHMKTNFGWTTLKRIPNQKNAIYEHTKLSKRWGGGLFISQSSACIFCSLYLQNPIATKGKEQTQKQWNLVEKYINEGIYVHSMFFSNCCL